MLSKTVRTPVAKRVPIHKRQTASSNLKHAVKQIKRIQSTIEDE
jgi:hypothetical protein